MGRRPDVLVGQSVGATPSLVRQSGQALCVVPCDSVLLDWVPAPPHLMTLSFSARLVVLSVAKLLQYAMPPTTAVNLVAPGYLSAFSSAHALRRLGTSPTSHVENPESISV